MNWSTQNEAPDSELIRRSVAGDRDCFGALVRRYQRFAIGVAYRITGESHVAEDLAQEAFIKAWTSLPDYRGESSFRGWLARIVTNTAIDHLRKNRPEVELQEWLPSRIDSPPAQVLREELQDRVRAAVLALPPAARAALVLREYEGLSYREIAGALDVPIGTVMSRLNYARARLREMLAGEEAPAPAGTSGNVTA